MSETILSVSDTLNELTNALVKSSRDLWLSVYQRTSAEVQAALLQAVDAGAQVQFHLTLTPAVKLECTLRTTDGCTVPIFSTEPAVTSH